MKITKKDIFTIIEAEEDMILVNKEGYGAVIIYLGIYDDPSNYTEIPLVDYVEPSEEEEIFEDLCLRILEEEVNK